jgi:hypothetical protein
MRALNIREAVSLLATQTVSQTDKLLLEYMKKRNITLEELNGNLVMQRVHLDEICASKVSYWYKGELIFSLTSKSCITSQFASKEEFTIEKGNW